MSELVDKSGPTREGEELPLDTLAPYLRQRLDAGDAEVKVEQFPGGHSNLTYAVTVGDRELVLRRPPFGSKVKSAHDMSREWRMLSALAPTYDRAPTPVLFCDDPAVMGCDFYLMERLRGVILRKRPPKGLELTPELAAALCNSLVAGLVDLHALDYEAVGLGDFGKPEGYVERQVTGWTGRYEKSQTDDIPQVTEVARWLADNMPASQAATILHNDYKFDNMVLAPDELTRIVGILDWEMSTVGDPLMDLGTSLSYWVQDDDPAPLKTMGFGPTAWPGMYTRRQVADAYAERSGRDVSNVLFYFVYGLFKTAVVVQQIYYRYKQGLTQDERFAMFIMGVRLLVQQAGAAIDKGDI